MNKLRSERDGMISLCEFFIFLLLYYGAMPVRIEHNAMK